MNAGYDGDLSALATALRASTVRVVDGRRGAGSGVVWSTDGNIVSNAHVVRGKKPVVIFENGRDFAAEVLRRDDRRDLALLTIDGGGQLPAVEVRDAATLRPGELVVAVGNPLGFIGALSAGTVQRSSGRYVVTDVRLAPGNSGGPLADARGRVVGINSMVAGGMALAVPSGAVRAFLAGGSTPAHLGVTVVAVGLPGGQRRIPALLVTGVAGGSPAERAGLELGDAIVGTDAGPVGQFESIPEALGHAASLDIVRAGQGRRLAVPHEPSAGTVRAA